MDAADSIFALASASGTTAVRVFRISGSDLRPVISALGLGSLVPRRASLRSVRDPNTQEIIDRGLVLWFPAPSSFTGEDCLELHLHGSVAVERATLRLLGNLPGCRMARPGEFAWRAFSHGKLDLTAAEGLADLIEAKTDFQRRQALAQANGALREASDRWRSRLLDCLMLAEAEIDFEDEPDAPKDSVARIRLEIRALASDLEAVLAQFTRAEIIKGGFCITLMGPPNSGKSSLMNYLAKREISIVTDKPGTTRDLIEAAFDLDGVPITLVDTAGLRESLDEIENIGIGKSLAKAKDAHLIIWLSSDAGEGPPGTLQGDILPVRSKVDLWPICEDRLGVSTVTGEGIEDLLRAIRERALGFVEKPELNLITQERHLTIVRSTLTRLYEALENLDALEVIAEGLKEASRTLESLCGSIEVEDVLGAIFSRFCIGK